MDEEDAAHQDQTTPCSYGPINGAKRSVKLSQVFSTNKIVDTLLLLLTCDPVVKKNPYVVFEFHFVSHFSFFIQTFFWFCLICFNLSCLRVFFTLSLTSKKMSKKFPKSFPWLLFSKCLAYVRLGIPPKIMDHTRNTPHPCLVYSSQGASPRPCKEYPHILALFILANEPVLDHARNTPHPCHGYSSQGASLRPCSEYPHILALVILAKEPVLDHARNTPTSLPWLF